MIIALNNEGERINAIPNTKAICPGCKSVVVSKCGEINVWHWSHLKDADCDSWNEPESLWHKEWKEKYPKEIREVVIGCHRADIKTKRGVIELQSDTLQAEKIIEREEYYGKMIWLLKGMDFQNNINFREKGDIFTFRWKHPRKSWFSAKKSIFIDMEPMYEYFYEEDGAFSHVVKIENREIFWIKKLYPNLPCGGWGIFISREKFIRITA